jgi:hypothetical protein
MGKTFDWIVVGAGAGFGETLAFGHVAMCHADRLAA